MTWRQANAFSQELTLLIQNLQNSDVEPEQGLKAMISFFKSDKALFNYCDDSDGDLGLVFKVCARRAFVEFASRIRDKKSIVEQVLSLVQEDDYGVRGSIVDSAIEYLDEQQIRMMIFRLQSLAQNEKDKFNRLHWYCLLESLARQIKDAPLYEEVRLEHSNGKLR